ncbi:MAG: sodium:solute symporter family protein [Adhaeribacter sp.]
MQQLDFIVMAAFALFILLVGLAFARTGSDTKSFFAAGENAPWWVSGLSLFMSFLSAGTFVVWGSIAYDQGLVAITIQMTMCVGGLVTALFIAPRWKRAGALTAAEYIGNRLGTRLQQFFTYVFLLVALVTTAQVLYPVGKLVYLATPFSLEVSILLLGLMIIVYTAVGGLWAVMVTDVLQFVILFAAVLVVLPLSLDYVGGWDNFIAKAPENFFAPLSGDYSLGFILAFTLYHCVYISGSWPFVQRYTSVKTEKESRKVAFLFVGMYLVSPFIWMLPPMIYRVMNPDLSGLESEGAYLLICKKILPAGLMGLMLAAMISATASTANTILNLLAAVFTNDIYKKLLQPRASEKQAVAVGRLATVVFGLITIALALLVPKVGGLVSVVLAIGAITGGSLLAPVIWTLFSRRQTAFSILLTSLCSLALSLFFKFLTPFAFDFTLSKAAEMILGIGFPLLLLAFFEWVVYRGVRESKEYVTYRQWYLGRVESKADLSAREEAEGLAQNAFGIKAISVGLAITGGGIGVLGLIAGEHQGLVAGLGLVIMLISLPTWWLAVRSGKVKTSNVVYN